MTTFTYDKAGNLLASVDPEDKEDVFSYDALNRMTRQVGDAGNIVTVAEFSYDARSLRMRVRAVNGLVNQNTVYAGGIAIKAERKACVKA